MMNRTPPPGPDSHTGWSPPPAAGSHPPDGPAAPRRRLIDGSPGRLLVGLSLIGVGVILMLEPLGIADIDVRDLFRAWPLWLVGIGAVQIATNHEHDRRGGVWLVVIGGWFLLDRWTAASVRDTWPLLLAVAGGMLIWEALSHQPPRATREERDDDR